MWCSAQNLNGNEGHFNRNQNIYKIAYTLGIYMWTKNNLLHYQLGRVLNIFIVEPWAFLWWFCPGWIWTGCYHAIKKFYKQKCELEADSLWNGRHSSRTLQVSVCMHTHTHTQHVKLLFCILRQAVTVANARCWCIKFIYVKYCYFNTL
jgi:hypothetical protein